jgi:hypothetical protein
MNASQLKFKMNYVFTCRLLRISRKSFSFKIYYFKTILARKHKNMIVMFQEVNCCCYFDSYFVVVVFY